MSNHEAASTNRPRHSDDIVPLLLGKPSCGIIARQMDEAHPEPRLFWLPAPARRSGPGRRGSYRNPQIASAQAGLSRYCCRTAEPKSQTRTGLISLAQAHLRVPASAPGDPKRQLSPGSRASSDRRFRSFTKSSAVPKTCTPRPPDWGWCISIRKANPEDSCENDLQRSDVS